MASFLRKPSGTSLKTNFVLSVVGLMILGGLALFRIPLAESWRIVAGVMLVVLGFFSLAAVSDRGKDSGKFSIFAVVAVGLAGSVATWGLPVPAPVIVASISMLLCVMITTVMSGAENAGRRLLHGLFFLPALGVFATANGIFHLPVAPSLMWAAAFFALQTLGVAITSGSEEEPDDEDDDDII